MLICEINENFKIFETSKKPDKTVLNKKEKDGYKISLVIKHEDNKKFLNHLKLKFRKENKEIKKGSYPLLKLDLDYIKSKSEVIFYDNNK